ncbi:hypothetical protein O3M35_000725 [Rhynocoris fuscipes]|uniref:Uncharacterized protein n=1 Tax=Rhynocoris fuscipes TaxID=488301 RepID=A0AAW1DNR2_9HEMI
MMTMNVGMYGSYSQGEPFATADYESGGQYYDNDAHQHLSGYEQYQEYHEHSGKHHEYYNSQDVITSNGLSYTNLDYNYPCSKSDVYHQDRANISAHHNHSQDYLDSFHDIDHYSHHHHHHHQHLHQNSHNLQELNYGGLQVKEEILHQQQQQQQQQQHHHHHNHGSGQHQYDNLQGQQTLHHVQTGQQQQSSRLHHSQQPQSSVPTYKWMQVKRNVPKPAGQFY